MSSDTLTPWLLAQCVECGLPEMPFRDAAARAEWVTGHAETGHRIVVFNPEAAS